MISKIRLSYLRFLSVNDSLPCKSEIYESLKKTASCWSLRD